jgi:UPF0755 protein
LPPEKKNLDEILNEFGKDEITEEADKSAGFTGDNVGSPAETEITDEKDVTGVLPAEIEPPVLPDNKKSIYEALLDNLTDDDPDEPLSPDEAYDEFDEETYEDSDEDSDEDGKHSPKGRRRKQSSAKHLIFGLVLTAIIVSLSVLASAFIVSAGREFLGLGRGSNEILLDIEDDMTIEDAADMFLREGIITDKDLFMRFTRIRGLRGMVSGSHLFRPNMTYGDLADELLSAGIAAEDETKIISVTFPEGITLKTAAEILEDNGVCDATEFINTFNTASFGYDFESSVRADRLEYYKMEGFCFPDTYQFFEDEEVISVVKKIYRNFNNKFTPDIIGRAEDMGLTIETLITFASIVQSEAPTHSDMKKIASVFWNRLNDPEFEPKRLQSDPTRGYVENIIMPSIGYDATEVFSAYNTYTATGLPPGAICNPGMDAVDAVLYPAETNYLYFCANVNTSETFYAVTLEEHEENLKLAGIV